MPEFKTIATTADVPAGQGKIFDVNGNQVAIWNLSGNYFAFQNICPHRGGPVGEGEIEGNVITCPWHGYQYVPETGASPPPFVEKVPTFNVRVKNGRVFVHPKPNPAGTKAEPAKI